MEINLPFFIINGVTLSLLIITMICVFGTTLPGNFWKNITVIILATYNVVNYSIFIFLSMLGIDASALQLISIPLIIIEGILSYLLFRRI
jgi:hypothetical protein